MFSPVFDKLSVAVVVVFLVDVGRVKCAGDGFLEGRRMGSLCRSVQREEGSGAGS